MNLNIKSVQRPHIVSFRLEPEVYSELREIAKINQCTIHAAIRAILGKELGSEQ